MRKKIDTKTNVFYILQNVKYIMLFLLAVKFRFFEQRGNSKRYKTFFYWFLAKQ